MSVNSKGRKERARLKRRGFLGIGEADVVGMFSHHKPANADFAISEHKVESEEGVQGTVYTLETEGSKNVVELGTEQNCIDEGFDYVVAVVNKNTGETSYRPARLFQFQARYAPDPKVLLGQKRKAPVDYDASHTLEKSDWAEKRSQLTENFGSLMKIKIQEASVRRSINNDTLNAMVKTSFASESVIKDKEDIKLSDVSMVSKAQSVILPPAVQAEMPRNIYPISLFITADEVEFMKESAESMLQSTKKVLLDTGFPEVLLKMIPAFDKLQGEKAVAFVYLGCMAYVLSLLGKSTSMLKTQMSAVPFPPEFVTKIQADFLPATYDKGLSGKGAARLILNTEQKERLIAHTFALAITLSPGCSIPITPWQILLKCAPSLLDKILVGLGCDIVQCNMEEAVSSGSIQAARLLKPPSAEKKPLKKIRR